MMVRRNEDGTFNWDIYTALKIDTAWLKEFFPETYFAWIKHREEFEILREQKEEEGTSFTIKELKESRLTEEV